jgi:hypothetical protein
VSFIDITYLVNSVPVHDNYLIFFSFDECTTLTLFSQEMEEVRHQYESVIDINNRTIAVGMIKNRLVQVTKSQIRLTDLKRVLDTWQRMFLFVKILIFLEDILDFASVDERGNNILVSSHSQLFLLRIENAKLSCVTSVKLPGQVTGISTVTMDDVSYAAVGQWRDHSITIYTIPQFTVIHSLVSSIYDVY